MTESSRKGSAGAPEPTKHLPTSSLVYPSRRCTHWCTDGTGHADEHPDDRSCWSMMERLALSRLPAIKMTDGQWWMSFLTIFLRRRPEEDSATVVILPEETDQEIIFTLPEAELLRDVLDALLAQARR